MDDRLGYRKKFAVVQAVIAVVRWLSQNSTLGSLGYIFWALGVSASAPLHAVCGMGGDQRASKYGGRY